MLCDAPFITPDWARDLSKKSIKPEISPKKAMQQTKKPARRMTTIKAEKELNVTTFEPTEDGELDDYDNNITYDNYGSDDDDYSHSTGFEPQVDLHESSQQPTIIDIKTEKSFEEESVQINVPLTVDHIRKVKREQIAKQQAIKMVTHKNPFAMNAVKVKKEVENGNQSTVKVLNPFSGSNDSKKVFKIPQALAMKIKKEKYQKSSVVVQNETDEADADPEEEEQMRKMALAVVKEEKEKSTVVKQLINPMAVAMLEKPNESNSLIISAVSSISEEHHILPEEDSASKMMTEIPAEFTKTIHHEVNEQETLQPPSDIIEEDASNILEISIHQNNQIEDLAVNNSNSDELDELLEKYCTSDIQDEDIQDLLKFD